MHCKYIPPIAERCTDFVVPRWYIADYGTMYRENIPPVAERCTLLCEPSMVFAGTPLLRSVANAEAYEGPLSIAFQSQLFVSAFEIEL